MPKSLRPPTPALVNRKMELDANKEAAKSVSAKIEGLEGLAKSKSNWINLFIDLENKLMEQKDVWLDNLRVVRTGEAPHKSTISNFRAGF